MIRRQSSQAASRRLASKWALAGAAGIAAGCTSIVQEQADFDHKWATSLHAGMDEDKALAALQSAGMHCDLSRDQNPNVNCATRESRGLASCIWRVTFTIDSATRTIGPVTPHPAACVGP